MGNGTATSTLTYLLGDHLDSTLTFKADTYATTQLYKPWGNRKEKRGWNVHSSPVR